MNPPAIHKTWVWSLGCEDALEEGMPTHCSSLAWRIPWAEKPGGLQSTDWQRVRHDYVIKHTKAFRMMVLGWNHLKGIDNESCEAALCYICEFFHWNIVLPAGARHFTWNSAYCSVLSSKTFSVLFLSLCRKSIRRETCHNVLVLLCERFFLTPAKMFPQISDGIQLGATFIIHS